MEIETLKAACKIYDTIQAIERTQSSVTNILNLLEKVDLRTLVDEMKYDLIITKVETEAKNAIKEELKKMLVGLEAEKSIKERELERL